jgi:hypothetical protein
MRANSAIHLERRALLSVIQSRGLTASYRSAGRFGRAGYVRSAEEPRHKRSSQPAAANICETCVRLVCAVLGIQLLDTKPR